MQFNQAYKEYDTKANQELNKTGIFYAFNQEQFNKNKKPQDTDTDFIHIGGGGYIHKTNKHKLDKYFNDTLPRLKQELTERVNINDLIEYELINHECYYTNDYTEIIDVVKSYYKDINEVDLIDKIKSVFKAHRQREDN